MADRAQFDVLVIGSGASGLAAAVSADRAGARTALATKGSIQACNSSKAQGGIQAAFGADDSPGAPRRGRLAELARDGRHAARRGADGRRAGAIHWLEELGVAFTRENGGYRLARCGGASAKRLLQVGDRTGHAITKALREAWEAGEGTTVRQQRARRRSSATENGWRARVGERDVDAGTVVLAAGGRCYAVAEERGELSTNHPNATGEVTQIALGLGAEARDLDALQYHPNGGAWPANMQGYSIPETTRAYGAVLLNADGEEFTDSLGPRDTVSQAIFDEVEAGSGVETPDGRPAVLLDTTRISEADAEISLPYMLRRYRGAGIDPLRRADPHLPRPPLPERRPRHRHGRRDDARGPLRLRRDRRRHARAQPHDGQLPARVRRLRAPRRQGSRDEGEGMSVDVTTDLQQAVEDAAAHLYVWALKDIPQDLRDALAAARERETSVSGKRVLDIIHRNVDDRRRARRTSSARTRASPSTTDGRRALPAPSRRGSTRRCATAPRARRSSTRCARTPSTRSRARTPGRTSATGVPIVHWSSSPTGTAST